jgi:putative DNA methylase
MVWDFAEGNPFSGSSGNFEDALGWTTNSLERVPCEPPGTASQADALTVRHLSGQLVSTDPPYYDNVGYADLSDFFYVWLRRSLGGIYPDLFSTLLTPKAAELAPSVPFPRRCLA